MIKFSFFGINVEISFLAVCFLNLLLVYDNANLIIWGILASGIHEIFHIIFLCMFSAKPKNIAFGVFGFKIKSYRNLSYFREFVVLASGCFGNFLFFLLCLKLGFFCGAVANFCLMIFNLLPHENLDGGQLVLIIFEQFLDFETSLKLIKIISVLVSIMFLIFGTFSLIWFKNISIFLVSVLFFLFLFQ